MFGGKYSRIMIIYLYLKHHIPVRASKVSSVNILLELNRKSIGMSASLFWKNEKLDGKAWNLAEIKKKEKPVAKNEFFITFDALKIMSRNFTCVFLNYKLSW